MKKTNLMALALLGMSAGIAINAEAGQETAATQMNNNKNMQYDCSKLSKDEQDFAAQLSSSNRSLFCGKFSSSQRKSAMMLACAGPSSCGSNRGSKKALAPNDAVSKVARDNRISMEEKRENATEPSDGLQAKAESPAGAAAETPDAVK